MGYEAEVLSRSIPLRVFDEDMRNKVVGFMQKLGVTFTQGQPMSFEKKNGKIVVKKRITKDGKQKEVTDEYDTVIQAIGRENDFSKMNLENIDLKLTKNNKITVDESWNVGKESIYSIGDIVEGNMELTPVAIH